MKHVAKAPVGLAICLLIAALLCGLSLPSRETQAFQSPLFCSPPSTPQAPTLPEIILRDMTGETIRWPTFTAAGFTLRYPTDWQARVLPKQIAGTRVVEFTHSTPDGRVDAAIQVWETELFPGEVWEQEPELVFWREHGARERWIVEPVLVNGWPGWRVRISGSVVPGTLVQTVFVEREGRLYRLRLYLYQDMAVEPYVRVLRLMMGTMRTREGSMTPRGPMSSESAEVLRPSSAAPASMVANYNRGAAYAYAQTWWNRQDNDDGCYLWYNGSTLDCTYHSGDWGVDGAHFVNRAVAAGGRPIPGLWNAEARTVSALRTWLLNDGWTVVSAGQAQVGDVVIIGDQCWAGLVVGPGNPPVVATHSIEWWGSAGPLYCNGNYSKEYLHAPYGGWLNYLPVVLRNWPPPPPKQWSGMHLGNRTSGDWSSDMLAPLDGTQGGIWPKVAVALTNQVFNISRDANCRINGVSVKNPTLFGYLRRAVQEGGTQVIFRVYPSPGNFEESIDPNWPDPRTRPAGRTLITQPGVRPGGWSQCGNEWRFRPVDDIGDEMLAIQRYILWQAPPGYQWQAFGFEPANEPNVEWYGYDTQPALNQQEAWQAMDEYFANLYDYVQANRGYLPIRVLTPPMGQSAYAETRNVNSEDCPPFEFSGYAVMSRVFNSANPKNDGYSWHNYWIQGREAWAGCPNGQHVSMWFPAMMASNIDNDVRPAVITEADLASPGQGMGNPLTDKDARPQETAVSIRDFLYHEARADWIAVWLLNDDSGNVEQMWHQAYTPIVGLRPWFTAWWYGRETP